MNEYDFTLDKKKNEDPEFIKKATWRSFLQNYGHGHTVELDIEIANSIERGYFDHSLMAVDVKKFNDSILIAKKDQSHSKAWDMFHHNFDDVGPDLIEKMFESTKSHILHINQGNLSGSVWLLRQLGADDKADEIIEMAISQRKDLDYFNLERYAFRDRIVDKRMIERFAEFYSAQKVKKTPLEVLQDITKNNGWGPDDEEILASIDENEYYKIFKSEKSKQLNTYIRRCLEFGQYQDATSRQKKIASNARKALLMIGAESDLNKLRLQKYGVYANEANSAEEAEVEQTPS